MHSETAKIQKIGKEASCLLSISLVLYKSPKKQLRQTLQTLRQAVSFIPAERLFLLILDNASHRPYRRKKYRWHGIPTEIITGLGNLGFGKAHNLVLRHKNLGTFHLILNPDVLIEQNALKNGLKAFQKYPNMGLCAPAILTQQDQQTHLGRNYPDLLSLALRGFAPNWLKSVFKQHLACYEIPYKNEKKEILKNIPCLSGSFLLMRRSIFKQLQGFDSRFFLYFEDFDFSFRALKITDTAILPNMLIRHFGGNTSRKGLRHILFFIKSAFLFFQKHGWKWH
ncbi:glycosyltransferase family 2 protein [Acetobacteraceae bacterium]|nr:glycosyltransferase family 2 protein [Acetobacteraceae bacterium]